MINPSRRIKLVSLIGQLGPGGSERQLFLLLSHLNPAQFERHVIVFNSGRHDVYNEALQQHGIQVWTVPKQCRGVRARLQYVTRVFRQIGADIVHSWTVHDNPYAGIGGWLARVPVRWGSLRSSLFSEGIQNLPFLYRYLSLNTISKIVVNSNNLACQLTHYGLDTSRIIELPNCVLIDVGSSAMPDLSDLGITAAHRLIGIVGNVRHVKNHMLFINGMARVLPHYPNVRAVIVGQTAPSEADLRQRLIDRIDELGLKGRIVLAGYRADVPDLMHRFSLFCLTSRSEGMPNVLLEAMAAGRPVVATRVNGVPEIIKDGQNGLLVESEDEAAFAQAVLRLLDDQALARRLGNAGYQSVVTHYSCDTVARQLASLYQEALAENSRVQV